MSLTTGYLDYNNSKAENQGGTKMELTIAEKKLCIKEYAGQRVVTFADIDTVHQRAVGTASRNFRENRKRFIEGTDYFVLIGDALRDYKQATNFVGRKINELHLITETGYLMLVKSFTDDLAWSVQRELVNNYFKVKLEPKREEPVFSPEVFEPTVMLYVIDTIKRLSAFGQQELLKSIYKVMKTEGCMKYQR